jgi:hypothetical protein
MVMANEDDIAKTLERINQGKHILEVTNEMRTQVHKLCREFGIHIHAGDLDEVDRIVQRDLNSYRLQLARLRGE